jgi:hypothetical protein
MAFIVDHDAIVRGVPSSYQRQHGVYACAGE